MESIGLPGQAWKNDLRNPGLNNVAHATLFAFHLVVLL